jgi:ubiquinone/menaquinone biosynthesis C-methylase UbiE
MERPFRGSSRLESMEHALRLQGFPALYERHVVPGLFAPWAGELIERARPIGPADRLLDLGCGTGIVSRVLRERLGGGARITGVDMNPQMIEAARLLAPELDWRVGNAMDLPFADASFDVVVSQQMLQFPADRALALREARRVLAPGGRLVVATWRARRENPLHDVLAEVARRHFGVDQDRRYSLGDGAELRALLAEAGFDDVRVETVTRSERHTDFAYRLTPMAIGCDLSAMPDADRERALDAFEADARLAIAPFLVDGALVAPSATNLATATAPR